MLKKSENRTLFAKLFVEKEKELKKCLKQIDELKVQLCN